MSKTAGLNEAIRLAVDKLQTVDMHARSQLLGLGVPENGVLNVEVYSSLCRMDIATFALIPDEKGAVIKPADYLTLLHYLNCDVPIKKSDQYITFREMSGGQFYWGPFLSRSIKPLVGRIGNDLELLKKNLQRFEWQPVSLGDFAAQIQVVGEIAATLVYRIGDEEFPATADILFDASIKRVYCAEDVAVISSRICIGLL